MATTIRLSGWRIAASVTALIVLGFIVLILNKAIEPFHRGFFCTDETIVYPFRESTIKSWVLFVAGGAIPILLIIFHTLYLSRRDDWCHAPVVVSCRDGELNLKPYQAHFLQFVFIFLLGAALNQTVTDVGKGTVGRLRPNFISVCKPNYTAIECYTTKHNIPKYVTDYTCTNPDKSMVRDSRKSFPSGHSSGSVYLMAFAVLYLEHCLVFRRMQGVRQFANTVLLLLAFVTCLSRIDDNKHHWSDVLSGAIIGATVAIVVFWVSFPRKERVSFLPASQQPQTLDSGEIGMEDRNSPSA